LTAFTLLALAAWTLGYADAAAFKECALKKLVEILEIATVTIIISIIIEHGIGELAERAGVEVLKKLAAAIGKKFVPWLGAILILIELAILLKDCLPLLFQ
jgi:hypothetical protein